VTGGPTAPGPTTPGPTDAALTGPVDLTGLPPVAGTLADVMPAVAAAVGVRARPTVEDPLAGDRPGPAVVLPPARNAVVVLVDGLGDLLLARRGGHAPFLRRLRAGDAASTLTSGFPSTTATSMAMLGTGTLPGSHGLVGLDVLDPARDVLFNELAWDPQVDPRRWQPLPTVFEELAGAGHDVVRVGPAYFDGSGLTEAALRGGRFVAAASLEDRVEATLAAVRRAPRTGPGVVVYLYWGELDKTGHVHGSGSFEWGEELAAVDGAVRTLVARLRSDTLVVVTADHGMVDIPFDRRVDLGRDAELAAGVRHVGGEPRSVQLYCSPGAAADVAAVWRARFGDRATVLLRDEAVAAGWFGPVEDRVLPRIGDVVTSMRGDLAVVDSRTARPEILRLLGLHGARTPDEALVPLVVTHGTGR
jgi:hypothetical protein